MVNHARKIQKLKQNQYQTTTVILKQLSITTKYTRKRMGRAYVFQLILFVRNIVSLMSENVISFLII